MLSEKPNVSTFPLACRTINVRLYSLPMYKDNGGEFLVLGWDEGRDGLMAKRGYGTR